VLLYSKKKPNATLVRRPAVPRPCDGEGGLKDLCTNIKTKILHFTKVRSE